ncbi:MAG: DUF3656 domain-containing protein, partial [Thermoplasmata archaeon]
DISKIFTRGFSTGYYFGLAKSKEGMNYRSPENQGLKVGVVSSYDEKNGILGISLDKSLKVGEGIEIWGFGDKRRSIGFQVRKIVHANYENKKCKNKDKCERKDELKGYVEILVPSRYVDTEFVEAKEILCKGAEVYITSSPYALERAQSRLGKRKIGITIGASCVKGRKLKVWVEDSERNRVEKSSENEIENAKNMPTSKDEIERQLRKLGETPFFAKNVVLECEEDVFVPFGVLNSLKKECVNELVEARKNMSKRKAVRISVMERLNKIKEGERE